MMRVRLEWYDAAGIALAAAFAAWTVTSAVVREGSPWPQLALLAAAVAAYVVGRIQGGRRPVFVPAAVVVSILVGTVASGPAALSGGPLAPPLGYANANGALYTLGVASACTVAILANKEPVRLGTGVLAMVFVGLAISTWSKTAAILAVGVLAVGVAARRLGRWVVVIAPLMVLATFAVTVVLGLNHGSLPSLFEELSARRTALWRDAMEIIADEPVFGAGPGMFAETSPTALADADARWAHSAYLQAGAETGVIGAMLLGLLLLWVFGALFRSRQDMRLVVIGTAAVTAFAVHATIDYVAHFPAVVIVAALLAGLTSSRKPLPAEGGTRQPT
jgi:O-antigen ligase